MSQVMIDALRAEVQSNLTVSGSVLHKSGPTIDVGEQFTMRFTVSNKLTGTPLPPFTNVVLVVSGTEFARPVAGDSVSFGPFNIAGIPQNRDVVFQALDKSAVVHIPPNPHDLHPVEHEVDPLEHVAHVSVTGHIDFSALFGNVSVSRTLDAQIKST